MSESLENRIHLSATNLQFSFEGPTLNQGQTKVFEKISFDVKKGEFVCILGPSGCGKSTLLSCLAGFETSFNGSLQADGRPVRGPDSKRLCLFQESSVFPWLTVYENVAFGIADGSFENVAEKIDRTLALVGLKDYATFYPRQLSGGMRQRLELARALAADADLLLMDEPFSALDYLSRLQLRSELESIWQREKTTIVMVTHDVEEALQMADRIFLLSSRPAQILRSIPISVPRPRRPSDPNLLRLREEIIQFLLVPAGAGNG